LQKLLQRLNEVEMDNIQTTVLTIHTLIALGIIALVLLQRGKGADAGAAFGAGASGTVFGAQGSTNFFSRTTAILATAFFATSLSLAYISSQRSVAPESIIEGTPVTESQPATPDAAPATEDLSELPELPDLDDGATDADDTEMPSLDDEEPAAETPPEE
jgi:preprotein translocase subunit SecG